MENTNNFNLNQKQFEFKLLRERVKSDFEKQVKALQRESADKLEEKIADLKEKFNHELMGICKSEDEWRAELRKENMTNGVLPVASAYTDETGKQWVRVRAGKYDFLLDIRNLTDKEVNWDEAMKLAANNGVKLPTKQMWSLVGAFIDEINAVIKELGGDILENWYWSASEYYSYIAWIFGATSGYLYNLSKMDSNSCRGSLALNS